MLTLGGTARWVNRDSLCYFGDFSVNLNLFQNKKKKKRPL